MSRRKFPREVFIVLTFRRRIPTLKKRERMENLRRSERKHHLLITGRPGVGKTTLVKRFLDVLQERDLTVIGFYTEEIREQKRRVGFRIMDVGGEGRGILSHVDFKSRFRIGKYHVNVRGIDDTVARLRCELEHKGIDVCILDEIGPMELYSKEFTDFVRDRLRKDTPRIVGTIKETALPLLRKWKVEGSVTVRRITERDRPVFDRIVKDILGGN
jgi:nucleoside-triphosphatase